MTKSPAAPIICEKCRTRLLSPTRDKHHRWCSRCRAKAFADAVAEAAPKPSADERRIRRVLPFGNYYNWLALYRTIMQGRVSTQLYVTKTTVYTKTVFRGGR